MNSKYAIVVFIVAILFSTSVYVSDPQIFTTDVQQSLIEEMITSDGPVPFAPLDLNIAVYNPSFEEADENGIPTNFGVTASAYQHANYSYQDNVASGNYACFLEAQGTPSSGTNGYIRNSPNFSPEPIIADGISLAFGWNTLANPDLHRGDRIYLSIVTTNSTGNDQWLYYYLSHSIIGSSNSSTTAHFLMNQTLNQWNVFDRNITADYESVPELGTYDSSRHIEYIYVYAYSLIDATGRMQVALDDFTMTNGTYSGWYPDGGFESGIGNGWHSYSSATGYVSQSSDSTHGLYSVELQVPTLDFDATGQCSIYQSVSNTPQGYYANSPDQTVLSFDWLYNDALGLTDQYSYLELYIQEGTTGNRVYIYLGHGGDTPTTTNSSTDKYVTIDGFGSRGSWEHAEIDLYEYYMMFGSTDMCFWRYEFHAYAAEVGASVTARFDNITIISDPVGDRGFEVDYFTSSSIPITSWYVWEGEQGVIDYTSDSHRGVKAANLTVVETDGAGIRRPTSVQLDPALFTDFWWRLDNISETGAGWAYIEISFNNSRFLTYRLGHSSQYTLPTNTSTNRQIIVDNFNETGVWNRLVRNMTYDASTSFGSSNFIVTRIIVNTYAGAGGRTSLIVDDFNFKDGEPPTISSVSIMTDPILPSTPVEVRVIADDLRPGVHRVDIIYSTGGTNHLIETTYDDNGWYTGYIPAQDFGTKVHFFVASADGSISIAADFNGTSYYNYTVTDVTVPVVSINTPLNDSSIEGTVPITISATDTESDIAYVEIWVDSVLEANLTTAPFDHPWNSALETPGWHTIEVIAYNNAGLSNSDSVSVSVLDQSTSTTTTTNTSTSTTTATTTSPEPTPDLPFPILSYVGAAVIVLILVVLVGKSRKK